MKMKKRIGAGVAAIALALSSPLCGEGTGNSASEVMSQVGAQGTANMTPKAILTQSGKASEDLTDIQANMKAEVKMTAQGETMKYGYRHGYDRQGKSSAGTNEHGYQPVFGRRKAIPGYEYVYAGGKRASSHVSGHGWKMDKASIDLGTSQEQLEKYTNRWTPAYIPKMPRKFLRTKATRR